MATGIEQCKSTPEYVDIDGALNHSNRELFLKAIKEIQSKIDSGEITSTHGFTIMRAMQAAADKNKFISNSGMILLGKLLGLFSETINHNTRQMPPLVVMKELAEKSDSNRIRDLIPSGGNN